jgi:hypothetical protein
VFSDAVREAGVSGADWIRWFARAAEACGGLGGPAGFDALNIDEVRGLFDELGAISEERARAISRGR